jgi:multidrug efflux pump
VARVELGREFYNASARYNGMPASGMAISLASGANALQTAKAVETRLKQLSAYFPDGLETYVPFDTTPSVRMAIYEVVKTMLEAVVLIFLVMYLFLQDMRATLIPTIAVPVVLLGTFAILSALGFSINTLTMFAMVLAIGLLIDDAIVVVENVERLMTEEGLSPREAARKSMTQITGALIGISIVLSAMFVPMAFFPGATGVIYRQFSITIVSAIMLSLVVAIILTPALCATMLKHKPHGKKRARRGFFASFNRIFDKYQERYAAQVSGFVKHLKASIAAFFAIILLMVLLFIRLPSSYLPEEDQGVIFAMTVLPAGSTIAQTEDVLARIDTYFRGAEKDSIDAVMAVAGFSFSGSGDNMGIAFIRAKDWDKRKNPAQSTQAVAARASRYFFTFKDAFAFAMTPPAVMELGTASGFVFELQDRVGLGHEALLNARNQLLGMAMQNPVLVGVRPNGQEDTPQFQVRIDNHRAAALGLPLDRVNTDINIAWGGAYINDFIDRGRIKKVYVQADAQFRMAPSDLALWHFRTGRGEMVPFSAVGEGFWAFGPSRLERYNGFPSFEILGQPAPGRSSGEAMAAMEQIASVLPDGVGFEWTGISYQERMAGNLAPMLFSISILVVFLCLAALYESWSVPFSAMLMVPLGIIGSLLAADMRGLSNDVYFQIGLLATMGLAARNAILIVEFAKSLNEEQGMSYVEAAIMAARLRLRPILMTALTFALGVLPLVLSRGAGSGGQNAVGTGVFGGTITATFLGIFFVPAFFVAINQIVDRYKKHA